MTTNDLAKDLTNLLKRLMREIILQPDLLKLEAVPMARSVTIYPQAGRGDTKRLIGTGGEHFRAFAAIARAVGREYGHGIEVELDKFAEPKAGKLDRFPDFRVGDDWPKERLLLLLEDTAYRVFAYPLNIITKDGPAGGGITNIDVLVSRSEDAETVAAMGAAFKTLFKSIGMANGRKLLVNVVANGPEAEPQPPMADGRFSREV